MGNTEDLYVKLQEAISRGDSEEMMRIQRKLVFSGRDKSLDEHLMTVLKDKTLGKNIKRSVREDSGMSDADYMKMISSLLTHIVIESESTGNSVNDYSIKEVYSLLGNFVNGSSSAVSDVRNFIMDRYSEFF